MSDPFVVPELTRSLRVLGAPHSLGGLHDRFFAPLIEARRSAARSTRWQDRVQAFDDERLEAKLRALVQATAAERHPASAPDHRALAAKLDDAFAGTYEALRVVRRAAAAVHDAQSDGMRETAWQQWVAALRALFSAADLGWEAAAGLLGLAEDTSSSAVSGGARRRGLAAP